MVGAKIKPPWILREHVGTRAVLPDPTILHWMQHCTPTTLAKPWTVNIDGWQVSTSSYCTKLKPGEVCRRLTHLTSFGATSSRSDCDVEASSLRVSPMKIGYRARSPEFRWRWWRRAIRWMVETFHWDSQGGDRENVSGAKGGLKDGQPERHIYRTRDLRSLVKCPDIGIVKVGKQNFMRKLATEPTYWPFTKDPLIRTGLGNSGIFYLYASSFLCSS